MREPLYFIDPPISLDKSFYDVGGFTKLYRSNIILLTAINEPAVNL